MLEPRPIPPPQHGQGDPLWVRVLLIGAALTIIGVLILVPVVHVFYQAFARGPGAYFNAIFNDPLTRHAIGLTLTVAPLAVGLNLIFGVAVAWCIARFRFPGRSLLLSLIDLPFAVSPVVAGLILMLVFGRNGYLGQWFEAAGLKIVFATPALVLATAFVTFPYVARELIPILEATGTEEEVAARSLGASGWQMFFWITLPNIKWGLLYGIILCNARAMGEFGAVSVVSGRISGETDTMPLRIEKLFQEPGRLSDAYALASLLTVLALVTLVLKAWLERRELPKKEEPK